MNWSVLQVKQKMMLIMKYFESQLPCNPDINQNEYTK